MAIIYLVRHGETDWNAAGRFMGQQDIALNARGREQAQQRAESLRDIAWAGCFSSDLSRCRETAEVIVSAGSSPRDIVRDARLREIHGGLLEGLTRDEQRDRFPEWWHANQRHGYADRFPEGETFFDLTDRVHEAMDDITRTCRGAEPVLVVTHGGVITALLVSILGLAYEKRDRIAVDNCSVTVIQWEPFDMRILTVNA